MLSRESLISKANNPCDRRDDKGQSGLDVAGGQGPVPGLPIPSQMAQTWQGWAKPKNKSALLCGMGWLWLITYKLPALALIKHLTDA